MPIRLRQSTTITDKISLVKENKMNKIYTVLLRDGTVGTIDSDTIEGRHASDFMDKSVLVQLNDENGNSIEVDGILVEILEENSF